MRTKRLIAHATVAVAVVLSAMPGMVAPVAATAVPASGGLDPMLLVAGLEGGAGSTIGPDGALYVTESAAGRVARVDPRTGAVSTFASGLPASTLGFGGARDVEFIGRTAYVLVTAVGPDVGGSNTVGIYRVDDPDSFTVVADIGAFSAANPPSTPFDLPTGVQYALETYRGGFLVTDGHHNRLLRVRRDGHVSERIAFANIVPTGLAIRGSKVYMAEAGPVPHLPEDGKVVSFGSRSSTVTEVASGAPLLVDVEFARGRTLYALSQGVFGGGPPGSPALPNTGSLVRVTRDGTFTVVADGLDRPTSLEFIGNAAYVVTLGGEIWKLANVSCRPHA
jgi:sugar lactone lactonase YvrE